MLAANEARRPRETGWLRHWHCLAFIGFFSLCHTAWATATESSDPSGRTVAQYTHTVWRAEQGAPAPLHAVTRDAAGGIWLASAQGLTRFDGATFRTLPSAAPTRYTKVIAARGGGIWAINGGRLERHFGNGTLKSYRDRAGWPTSFGDIAEDKHGTLWAATQAGVVRIRDEQLQVLASSSDAIKSSGRLVFDKDGRLFVLCNEGEDSVLAMLDPDADRFESFTHLNIYYDSLAVDRDGAVWVSTTQGIYKVVVGKVKRAVVTMVSREPTGRLLLDRSGGMWSVNEGGVRHVAAASTLALRKPYQGEQLTPANGLSSDVVWDLYQDADGIIWTATSGGLERFATGAFQPVKIPGRSLTVAIAPASGGRIWAAHYNHALIRTAGHALETLTGVGDLSQAVARDPDGNLWLASASDVIWLGDKSGRRSKIKGPTDDPIFSLAVQADGSLWVLTTGFSNNIYKLDHGTWLPQGKNGIPAGPSFGAIFCDAAGAVWLAKGAAVSTLRDGIFSSHDLRKEGLDIGKIRAFHEKNGRLWLAGDGVAVHANDRFQNLRFANAFEPHGVTGILELKDGTVWINSAEGAVRVTADHVSQAMAVPATQVKFRRFDTSDGLLGATTNHDPVPSLVQSDDGRLWFARTESVAWIRPDSEALALQTATVQVDAVKIDGREYLSAEGQKFPPLGESYQISFSGAGVRLPDHLKFQYRLEGVDTAWQDAGVRRVAFYNALSPGKYRFFAAAVADDGERHSALQPYDFEVLPAWFQTLWFRVFIGLMIVLALWLLYLFRLHRLVRFVEARQQATRDERNRVSREIHDTLLQSVYGLILRFQAIADAEVPVATRAAIESTLVQAEAIVIEGRDRVQNLRLQDGGAGDLMARLRDACAGHPLVNILEFSLTSTGTPREVRQEVAFEITAIFVEALANVAKHAHASEVSLTVHFSVRALQVELTDNGVGIPLEFVQAGRSGHWGLTGMRERAGSLGADLQIRKRPQAGTLIELRLRGATAYVRRPSISDRILAWMNPDRRLLR